MPAKDPGQITQRLSVFLKQPKFFPNTYDFLAFIFILTVFALIAVGVENADQSISNYTASAVSLELSNLPKYALYTTMRMFAAVLLSLLCTFLVATLAAKNRRAEMLIIPLIDILQSVPVLGFLAFTVAFFIGIFPGRAYGAELAAIFTVFSAQVWNMIFSLYQSLRTVPEDLKNVSEQFCLNAWQKYWRLEIPFAIPGLVWNTMLSMSSSWFFIVASEAISVGNIQLTLPGIGSWLGLAIQQKNLVAVGQAMLAMGIVILIYDQLIFRPIVAWSDKFNLGQTASQSAPSSWMYAIMRRTQLLSFILRPLRKLGYKILCWNLPRSTKAVQLNIHAKPIVNTIIDTTWYLALAFAVALAMLFLGRFLDNFLTISKLTVVIILALITLLRVFVLVLLSSLLWVPIGVWVGLRPNLVAWVQPVAQFLAAFPANILFPFFVAFIVYYHLDPDIWLSPLMILGTQWYIFFNVVAGVSVFPNDLREAAEIYQLRSWVWWRRVIIPAVLPYYITGAVTAAGGSWNASIVAELVSWGSTTVEAHGIGSYIAKATKYGDLHRVVLGVAVMCVIIVFINRFFWRKLYKYAAQISGINTEERE